MENVKYIPGDLVMTNGVPIGTKKGVVYVVNASNPNRTETFESGKVLKGTVTLDNTDDLDYKKEGFLYVECCAWVKDIVPIKLTTDILVKNGWDLYIVKDRNYWSKVSNDEELIRFKSIDASVQRIAVKDKVVLIYFGNTPNTFLFELPHIIIRIKYLHQLQHLLFGLGLDSSLKV